MIFLHAGAKGGCHAELHLNVNGESRTVEVRDPDEPLLYVLRNSLSLTGAKFGCGLASAAPAR
jgi:aerobic-type carbon monoxide dehydrogenase small subunit (CoxS/CutS family)